MMLVTAIVEPFASGDVPAAPDRLDITGTTVGDVVEKVIGTVTQAVRTGERGADAL